MTRRTPTDYDDYDDDADAYAADLADNETGEDEAGEDEADAGDPASAMITRWHRIKAETRIEKLTDAQRNIERFEANAGRIVELYAATIDHYRAEAAAHLAGHAPGRRIEYKDLAAQDIEIRTLAAENDRIWKHAKEKSRSRLSRSLTRIENLRSQRASLYAAREHLAIFAAARRKAGDHLAQEAAQ